MCRDMKRRKKAVTGQLSTDVRRETQHLPETLQNKNEAAGGLQVDAATSCDNTHFLWYLALITVCVMCVISRMYKISEPASVW